MCAPLSPHDEIEPPTAREVAEAAYAAKVLADRARHLMLLNIDDGAVAGDFLNRDPDRRLREVNRTAFEADYAYQQAAHTLMQGETYVGSITSLSLALAMQSRVTRNGKAGASARSDARLPAVVSPAGA